MAKSNRDVIKASLATAQGRIEAAQEKLIQVGLIYQADYPDIYEMYCGLVTVLEQVKNKLNDLRSV